MGILAAVATLSWGGAAAAQTKDADAERLFREGQKLLEERRYGEACPKFEQAYKKDGAVGTLLNLAFCHKEQGALWYAWLEFREAELMAASQKKNDRAAFAKQSRVDLEKVLPKVVVDNPNKIPITEVLVEDRHIPEGEHGERFTVEQGQRKFTFKGVGKKPTTVLITIMKGGKEQHVQAPDLADAPVEDPTPGPVATPGDPKTTPGADAGPDAGSTQRLIGWIALGSAAPLLVAGTITGIITLSSPCNGGKCNAPPTGNASTDNQTHTDKQNAQTTGLISTITLAAAGVFAVAGGILVLTAPHGPATPASTPAAPSGDKDKDKTSAHITPFVGPGSIGVVGTF